ncbi:unnamed protein product [Allacma fusca]|uniref:Uncharacterized protein n=1 Tax=Allacma fusca TaxID=39272 RepID=A0A8J2LRF0_9HEXA|nr:unnamed protein product [Allacma fusca]
MELKVFALTLLLACTANAFSLAARDTKTVITPFLDYGPQIKPVIEQLLELLSAINLPIRSEPLTISLEDLLKDVIGENATSPIKGTLTLSNIVLGLKPGATCDSVIVNMLGITAPIPLEVVVSLPGVGITADYDLNALLLGIIPVRGTGPMYAGVDITAGVVDSAFKAKAGSTPGSFTKFDYLLDLKSILVKLEGLLGGPEISDQINKIIQNLIDDSVTPFLVENLRILHPIIKAVIHDALNEAVKDITYQSLICQLDPSSIFCPKPPTMEKLSSLFKMNF